MPQLIYNSPAKTAARLHTIINPYKNIFGKDKLDKDSQLWTLAGSISNENGYNQNCELQQYLDTSFLEESQFFGVDNDFDKIIENGKIKPKANWIYGDFLYAMEAARSKNHFNPSIINFDTQYMPKKGCERFSRILSFLSYLNKEFLLIFNVMLKNKRNNKTWLPEEVIEELENNQRFLNNISKFDYFKNYYRYNGVKAGNDLVSFGFYKKF